ncbi:MAG: 3-hydroxybutyryl-CoA dehydrogenase [Flavobacteriales bacterium]|nr:3-hydroxybutyryl-CoA dehydrogenase [Flavobacteriales bacterium]
MKVSVIGSGTMGVGIAQIAATNGNEVCLYDSFDGSIENAQNKLTKILNRLVEKDRITQQENETILGRINFTKNINEISGSDIVIEAIIENLEIKQKVFTQIETIVDEQCILASNTSSLSIASIAASCKNSGRVLGIHFFNPAPLMPLVEIIPSVQTSEETLTKAKSIIDEWGKVTVIAKDTPGFIVNRVARSFYGEALRIYEEGIADFATIDWVMRELGGFRMGPFQLMDYIGNDINYTVTETVFTAFYFDPRYKPSFTQKRMMEAGYLGRKSGRGYYDYSTEMPQANEDRILGKVILWRVLAMLINEAADALFLNIATKEDIDLAMTKGVNYPKGLLAWADEIGLENVLKQLENLQAEYGEDRYRPSPLLKQMVATNKTFY